MAPRRFRSITGLSLQEALKAVDDKVAARGEAYRQRAQNFGSGGEVDSVAPGVAPHPMMSLGNFSGKWSEGQYSGRSGQYSDAAETITFCAIV